MSRGQGVVDPRAIVDPTARFGDNVTVGAWSIIGEGVHIGSHTVVGPHVVIQAGCQIGECCRIGPFSVLGADPMAPAFLDELAPGQQSTLDAPPVLRLGDDVLVHAQSRVVADVPAGAHVAGSPAVKVREASGSATRASAGPTT